MTAIQFRTLNWGFLRWWLIANLLGIFLGISLGLAIALIVSQVLGGLAEDHVPTMEIMGVVVAGLQGWVIHKYLGNGKAWMVVTSVAWLIGMAVVRTLGNQIGLSASNADLITTSLYLLLGLGLGVAQWLLLRRHVKQAGWWIVASALGWLLAGVMNGKSIDIPLDFLMLGVLPATLTGVVFVWLTRGIPSKPISEATFESTSSTIH